MAVREDVAASGTAWSPVVEWYARAVREMQGRPISDRTSWRYLAAIHGISVSENGEPDDWIAAGIIEEGDALPPQGERRRLWDQCQHGGWYFLPWHRGYLWAFEAIVAKTVRDLGGPDDWALPYWNYFDTSNAGARTIPQPFRDATMPDGSSNPLASSPREGGVLGPTPDIPVDIGLGSVHEKRYTAAPGTRGFGGGETPFVHLGNNPGLMELNPHNLVHGMIGGNSGYMSDPNYAALDPIFWLHHCNVDRLWAAWLSRSGNIQENGRRWREGPLQRRFVMPDAAGDLATFTPADTLPGGTLAPTYDDLSIGTGAATLVAGAEEAERAAMPATLSETPPPPPTLLGSSTQRVMAGAAAGTAHVALSADAASIASSPVEKRLYVSLQNVRGAAPTGVLTVSVGVPAAGDKQIQPVPVETVALFGLAKASDPNGPHAGNGLGVSIDITDAARKLMAETQAGLDQLDVHVAQPASAAGGDITIGKVSVVSQPVE